MAQGGFVQPQAGGRENTTVNKSTQLDIPRGIMVQSTLILCIKIWVWFLVAHMLLGVSSALVHYDQGLTRSYWGSVQAGAKTAWHVFRVIFWAPLVGCAWVYDRQSRLLIHFRWTPEQIDPHWPGPYKGRESSEAGQTFWDLFKDKHGGWGWGFWQALAQLWNRDKPEPEAEGSDVPAVIVQDEQGVMSEPSLPPLPQDNGKHKLLVLLRGHFGHVRPFSRAGAMRGQLYTRAEWDDLAGWCAHEDRQFYRAKRGLTPRGKSWARQTINALVRDNRPPTLPIDGIIGSAGGHPTHPIPSHTVGGAGGSRNN